MRGTPRIPNKAQRKQTELVLTRKPNRAERRYRGARRPTKHAFALIAHKRGCAGLGDKTIHVENAVGAIPKKYTRKHKLARRAIVERAAIMDGVIEQYRVSLLVWGARGKLGVAPFIAGV